MDCLTKIKFITMKKLLIASVIAGAAIAGLLFLLRDTLVEKKTSDQITDAAEDAYSTMNHHINKVERAFEPALN